MWIFSAQAQSLTCLSGNVLNVLKCWALPILFSKSSYIDIKYYFITTSKKMPCGEGQISLTARRHLAQGTRGCALWGGRWKLLEPAGASPHRAPQLDAWDLHPAQVNLPKPLWQLYRKYFGNQAWQMSLKEASSAASQHPPACAMPPGAFSTQGTFDSLRVCLQICWWAMVDISWTLFQVSLVYLYPSRLPKWPWCLILSVSFCHLKSYSCAGVSTSVFTSF